MARNILITGACGGIGRALCQAFVNAGDHVYAQDREAAQLDALVEQLGADKCTAVLADITNADQLKQALGLAVASTR